MGQLCLDDFQHGRRYGAQVGVTNRGIVFGQAMALFDPRPGGPTPSRRANGR